MPSYKTPGVYVEEISVFPPSVAAVETAIPVFLGYTEKAVNSDGSDLTDIPKRITSLLEYEQYFGTTAVQTFNVEVTQTWDANAGAIVDTAVAFSGTAPAIPNNFLYYSMQIFFANGGGPCWIDSLGVETALDGGDFTDAITVLEAYDEPTLIVAPDATRLTTSALYGSYASAALSHCAKMQDRFTILDVWGAGADADITEPDGVVATFRQDVAGDSAELRYGAAYFPYLATSLPFLTEDGNINVAAHTISGTDAPTDTEIDDNTVISNTTVIDANNAIYNEIKAFLAANLFVTLPPSGAVAGVYARVDADRGVWKAPANVSVVNTIAPAITITNDFNDRLNVDTTAGKSINAIRTFTGRGQLVWGARTLDGNSSENRYVPVRRFLNMAEESIKKATAHFVFEPNDANTWVKVRTMIENFLILQWRDGALQGAKPEHAFYVAIGLNQTMSAQDILDGYMIVEIGLAIVRPAEFIVLRFMQKMAES